MNHPNILNFLGQNVSILNGVGTKLKKILKKKKLRKYQIFYGTFLMVLLIDQI